MAACGVALVLGATTSYAQQASGISGVVRDSAGLPMPGVTVEAASPALIERVRTVSTDGDGRYSLVDLRPGVYSVTFSLEGFSTVKRDGVELTSGFTAAVSVAMQVGALSETITVSGAAPVVDTQSMRRQETLNQSQLESLPSGNIGLQTLAYMTPGFATTQADVGGGRDTWSAQGAYTLFHGKTGTRASFDGFRNQYFIGAANGVGYITDQGNIAEMQLETSGMGAESGSGSTSLNAIPKSGSNNFSLGLDGFFSNAAMAGSNIHDNLNEWTTDPVLLATAGIKSSGKVQRIYRMGGQFGGPIKQNRIWFFAAVARWGSRVNQPNAYYNSLQGKANIPGRPASAQWGPALGPTPTLFYPGQPGSPYANLAPDTSRPAASFDWYRNHSLRTTIQASAKNRLNLYGDLQKSCRCTSGPFTGANAIESERGWDWWPSGVAQATWTAPLTSRLLLEAGVSWQVANWVNFAEDGVSRDDRSILELSTNYRYGANSILTAPKARTGRSAQRFSVSYVTGTHNVKVGITDEQAFNDESRSRNNTTDGLNYDFLNGKPNRIQYYAQPFYQQERQNMELGIFAQDQWKIQRLTLNLGLRVDHINMGFPEADLAAGPFVPARHVDKLSGVPLWTDINPRSGFAYDVFGNGRTAIKVAAGRYNQLSRSDLTRRFHPFSSSVNSAFRNWSDANGDYIPDCNLADFTANGECGAISNVNFGKFIPSSTIFDKSVTNGNRDFLWDINAEIAHELVHGLSVSAAYNHNWDGSFTVTENTAVGPANYDEFCITVPNDPRLPNAGQQQCGYYDVQPAYFGVGTLRVTNAKEFFKDGQKQQRYWDGFTFSANGRLPRNITLGGGVDFGRQVDDHCITVDIPNQPADIGGANVGGPFCRIVTSWSDTLDARIRGSIPFRGGFTASFIYRNTPGAEQSALLTVTSAQVTFKNPARTTLTSSKTVNLIAPNSRYGDRFSQLDLSLSKAFDVHIGKLRTALDVYNALNSSSIQAVTTAYSLSGNRWLRPTGFLDARLARITASLAF